MKSSVLKSIVLVLSIMLIFAGSGKTYNPAVEIPPGPPNTLPDYIGAPAKPHPTANSGIPQNPYLAPNPFNTIHVDPWMSDVYDIPGPLGRDPAYHYLAVGGRTQLPQLQGISVLRGCF